MLITTVGGASVSVTAEPPMPIYSYPGIIICTVTYDEPTLPDPVTLYSPGADVCVTMGTDGTCTRPDTDCGKAVNISATCDNNADTREATIRLFNIGVQDYSGVYNCTYQQQSDTAETSFINSKFLNIHFKMNYIIYVFNVINTIRIQFILKMYTIIYLTS